MVGVDTPEDMQPCGNQALFYLKHLFVERQHAKVSVIARHKE
jgi:hypothetical protein